jgi:2-polyprenyl-3-methyl-5-hydroxy-6-metoxy-1,4-benzoquinol methylase
MSYENYEVAKQWKSDKFASYTSDERLCFNSELLDYFPTRELHQVNVCDIGFGNGNFMGWCRDQGWRCDGIEVNQFLIERAINNKLRAFSSIETLTTLHPGTTYDLITAFDVLEHIDRGQIVNFLTKNKVYLPQQYNYFFEISQR